MSTRIHSWLDQLEHDIDFSSQGPSPSSARPDSPLLGTHTDDASPAHPSAAESPSPALALPALVASKKSNSWSSTSSSLHPGPHTPSSSVSVRPGLRRQGSLKLEQLSLVPYAHAHSNAHPHPHPYAHAHSRDSSAASAVSAVYVPSERTYASSPRRQSVSNSAYGASLSLSRQPSQTFSASAANPILDKADPVTPPLSAPVEVDAAGRTTPPNTHAPTLTRSSRVASRPALRPARSLQAFPSAIPVDPAEAHEKSRPDEAPARPAPLALGAAGRRRSRTASSGCRKALYFGHLGVDGLGLAAETVEGLQRRLGELECALRADEAGKEEEATTQSGGAARAAEAAGPRSRADEPGDAALLEPAGADTDAAPEPASRWSPASSVGDLPSTLPMWHKSLPSSSSSAAASSANPKNKPKSKTPRTPRSSLVSAPGSASLLSFSSYSYGMLPPPTPSYSTYSTGSVPGTPTPTGPGNEKAKQPKSSATGTGTPKKSKRRTIVGFLARMTMTPHYSSSGGAQLQEQEGSREQSQHLAPSPMPWSAPVPAHAQAPMSAPPEGHFSLGSSAETVKRPPRRSSRAVPAVESGPGLHDEEEFDPFAALPISILKSHSRPPSMSAAASGGVGVRVGVGKEERGERSTLAGTAESQSQSQSQRTDEGSAAATTTTGPGSGAARKSRFSLLPASFRERHQNQNDLPLPTSDLPFPSPRLEKELPPVPVSVSPSKNAKSTKTGTERAKTRALSAGALAALGGRRTV